MRLANTRHRPAGYREKTTEQDECSNADNMKSTASYNHKFPFQATVSQVVGVHKSRRPSRRPSLPPPVCSGLSGERQVLRRPVVPRDRIARCTNASDPWDQKAPPSSRPCILARYAKLSAAGGLLSDSGISAHTRRSPPAVCAPDRDRYRPPIHRSVVWSIGHKP